MISKDPRLTCVRDWNPVCKHGPIEAPRLGLSPGCCKWSRGCFWGTEDIGTVKPVGHEDALQPDHVADSSKGLLFWDKGLGVQFVASQEQSGSGAM